MAASPRDYWSDEHLRRYAGRLRRDRQARMAQTAGQGGAWAPLEAVWVSLTGSVGAEGARGLDGEAVEGLVRHLQTSFLNSWERKDIGADPEGRPLATDEDRRVVQEAMVAVDALPDGAGEALVAEAWGRLWDLREERDGAPVMQLDSAATVRALTCCDLDRAARQHRRLLVVGAPGSGKTTLLSHLTYLAADGLLGDGSWLGAGEPAPVPVFVRLSRVAALLPESGPATGEAVIRAIAEVTAAHRLPGGRLEDALREGAVFVLLDALDEVASDGARVRVAEAVAAFAEDHEASRIVVSTRPDGYRDGERKHLDGLLAPATLHDLGRAQVRRLLGRWLAFLGQRRGLEGDAAATFASERLARGLEHLDRNPESWSLARRPITLVMLARVLEEAGGELPARPTELYERCVCSLAWLLDVKEREVIEQVPIGRAHPIIGTITHDQRLGVLERVAWRITVQGGDDVLSSGLVREAVGEALELASADSAAMDAVAAALASRSGLLVPSARGWSIAHRELRDYLAARHAVGGAVSGAAAGVKALLDDHPERLTEDWWRRVVVFAPGAALAKHLDGPAARDVALALAERAVLVKDRAERADAMAAVAAGLLDLRAAGVGGLEPVAAHLRAASERALVDPDQPGQVEGRFLLARVLGCWGDGRLDPAERWVEVPGGSGWRGAAPGDGSADRDEAPGHRANGSAFRIQRWCVTVAEYAAFVDAGGYAEPRWWHPDGWRWRDGEGAAAPAGWEAQRSGPQNLPVTGACWWEADAFCRWVTLAPAARAAWRIPGDHEVRLPTEAEWERAARGGEEIDGGAEAAVRVWPWGRDEDPHRALGEKTPGLSVKGYQRSGPEPVGCFPAGHGPYGAWDQAGNVWEWCLDAWKADSYKGPQPADPAVLGDGRAPESFVAWREHNRLTELPAAERRVVRGGSFGFEPWNLRASYRIYGGPGIRDWDLGFRCVLSPAGRVLDP